MCVNHMLQNQYDVKNIKQKRFLKFAEKQKSIFLSFREFLFIGLWVSSLNT